MSWVCVCSEENVGDRYSCKNCGRPLPEAPMPQCPTGLTLLRDPTLNKGTAFTEREREALEIEGLLPPHPSTIEEQVQRFLGTYRKKTNDLEKYLHLISLEDRNRTLFYRVLIDNIEEMAPIVYTPTVGQACVEYSNIFRRPRGIFLTANDKGRIEHLLGHWPYEARIIVVTDAERILGLGDIGANGMGIPVGKLSLYIAAAGVHPSITLPVTIDVGTEKEELLNDPLYIGLRQRRLRGAAYDELIDEFMKAAVKVFPDVLIQFEDFANRNAFRLLARYRDQYCTFNDDIQGTASVIVSGFMSCLRLTGGKLGDQKFLFFGAGEAGIGTGDLTVSAMMEEGLSQEEAVKRIWYVDSKGLVVKQRTDLNTPKLRYAHDHEPLPDLLSAIEALKPTFLIGASARPGMFNQPVIEAMARINEKPVIFALSNPTSKAECTAEQAYTWTKGRAIFASGSPFPPFTYGGKTFVPGQGNNVYIFPGVGLGAMACWARSLPDDMFLAAAKALAGAVTEDDLKQGRVYPPMSKIREASAQIAVAVVKMAYEHGLAARAKPYDIEQYVRSLMYYPEYQNYV
jgi:malate dehydrogenase (oxaloacetate-decarboxylating)(NADP+)